MKPIYLVGFMGTGKTSVGKCLAERLGVNFFDLDHQIEKMAGVTIAQIFKAQGETHFRSLETQALKTYSMHQDVILSCGGGIVLDDENIDIINSTGTAVCLTATPATVLQRIKYSNNRPLLMVDDPIKEIERLLSQRDGRYKLIKNQVCTDSRSLDEIIDEILKLLNN